MKKARFESIKVNSKYNIMDTSPGVHTQTIENLWFCQMMKNRLSIACQYLEFNFGKLMCKQCVDRGNIIIL